MESTTALKYKVGARGNPVSRRASITLALIASVVLPQMVVVSSQAAIIQSDDSANSLGEILYDSDAAFGAHNLFLTGRLPTTVKGPLSGGTSVNTLVGADAFYSRGYTGASAVMVRTRPGAHGACSQRDRACS